MIGRSFGAYQVLEELGRGGMGVVYRARETRLGREVALKVLAPELARDPELRERFLREAQAAACLSHPAITVVYAADEVDAIAFIAMELVRGDSLRTRLAAGALGREAALDVALEVAEALDAGHSAGIVHRDLKPANVMLTDSGRVKLIDFGLAKRLRRGATIDSGVETPAHQETDPGRIVGTAAYMSPEQARGGRVDARSDIFCFGALLYEMLAGAPAFLREGAVETLHAVLHDPTPALPAPGDAALQRLLEKCLEKDPEKRYQSARELAVDLGAARRRVEPSPSQAAVGAPARSRLRLLIVDDEQPARGLLREFLAAHDVDVVGECRNGFEAVKAVSELRPDLLLLDIQMPKLDGFEVVELVGPEVQVVFVTAYDEHALRAFEVNAVDYLLKPVSPERLAAALERARDRVRARTPVPVAALVASARREPKPLDRILVRVGAEVHVLPVERLDYARAQDDYVSLHSEGRELLKQQTLTALAEALDPARFVRIHRSYLLNVERLARIETEERDARVAVLRDGTRLPVSRAGFARLKALL